MRSVPAMDVSGLNGLISLEKRCRKNQITLVLSHVNEQPMSVMKKAGFDSLVGADNICTNIDAALERAQQIVSA